MDFGLKDKVALVTGAGSPIGIGKAIATTLADEGCHVIANDINLEEAEQTAGEIRAAGKMAMGIQADVADSAAVDKMVRAALEKFGKIDILVNNAGGATAIGPFSEQKEEDWDRDIGLNLKGVMLCSRAVLPQMLKNGYGKIISLSSGSAKTGAPTFEAYTATKAAIAGFTKSLAIEVAASGINVNCVAPGYLMTRFGGGEKPSGWDEVINSRVPQKNAPTPQDVANMVAFLASDVSINIVGQMYSVDGGFTMSS